MMTDRFNQKNISVPKVVWIMRQTWNDVLFAHWPVDPSILRDKVPSVLELDTYNGMAWIQRAALYVNGSSGSFSSSDSRSSFLS